jgi:hypothetical protein
VNRVTPAQRPDDLYQNLRLAQVTEIMDKEIDLLDISIAVGVAGYLAIIMGCIARDDLGLSNGQIRDVALFAAAAIAAPVAAGFIARAGRKRGS